MVRQRNEIMDYPAPRMAQSLNHKGKDNDQRKSEQYSIHLSVHRVG